MIQSIKKQIQYFITNKAYMCSLILAIIAGYGYEITHGTMGIDDACIELYFEEGLGVAIGRWPFYLINKIFRVTDFEPFLLDFVAVIIMMGAALLFSALIRHVVARDIPIFCYIIFSTLFVTYSLIAEIFIFYLQNGVPVVYCLIAISLFIFYYIQTTEQEKGKKIKYVAITSVFMCISIGFYESAANIFLFGVLLLMLIDMVSMERMQLHSVRSCIGTLFLMIRILVYGIVLRSVVTKICMWVFDIKPYEVRSMGHIMWVVEHPGRMVTIVKQIVRDYFIVGLEYYPIMLFVIATILFIIAVLWIALKKKNVRIALIGVATYASLFVLSVFQGEAVPYRANQMIALFVAVVFGALAYVVMHVSNISIKSIAMLLLVAVVYNSIYDLNQWFALDYKKNQIEQEVIHQIGYELESGDYDIENKPVVFVGEYRMDAAILKEYSLQSGTLAYELVKEINESMDEDTSTFYPYTQSLSESLVNWGINAFYVYEGYNREMIRLFEKEGYTLLYGGNELYQKGVARITDQERYPKEGYIKEYHDCIIVRF